LAGGRRVEALALVHESAGERPAVGRVLAAHEHDAIAGQHDEAVHGGLGVAVLHEARVARRASRGKRGAGGGATMLACEHSCRCCSFSPLAAATCATATTPPR